MRRPGFKLVALITIMLAISIVSLRSPKASGKVASHPSASALTFVLQLPAVEVEYVGGHARLRFTAVPRGLHPSFVRMPGAPLVPELVAIVLLPPGTRISYLDIAYSGWRRVVLKAKVEPCPPVVPVPLVKSARPLFNASVYASWRPWPPRPFSAIPLRWRGVGLLVLHLHTVRYIPANDTLLFATKAVIRVGLEPSPLGYADPRIARLVASEALNPDAAALYAAYPLAPGGRGGIIIVTRSMFVDALRPLVELRRKQGFDPVTVVTLEEIEWSGIQGADIQERIRNYVMQLYSESGGAYKYLLIVGDALNRSGEMLTDLSQLEPWEVPTRYFHNPDGYSTYTPCDLYYATFDSPWDTNGNGIYGEQDDAADWAPELAVARVPVRDVDALRAIVTKIVNYTVMRVEKLLAAGSVINYHTEEPIGYQAQGDTRAEGLLGKLRELSMLVSSAMTTRLYEHYPADTIIITPDQLLTGNLTLENMNSALREDPAIVFWFAHGSEDGAYRYVWVADSDEDGAVDPGELAWEKFAKASCLRTEGSFVYSTRAPPLVAAMSCLTADYESDYVEPALGEDAVREAAMWYLGWSRVTYTWLSNDTSSEMNPENWILADWIVYHFLVNLLSDGSPTARDVGWAYAKTMTDYAQYHDMSASAEYIRRVWMAATLLGDPAQPFAKANIIIEYLNGTSINATLGVPIRIAGRVLAGLNVSDSGALVRLEEYVDGTWQEVASAVSGADGVVVFELTFDEAGEYLLRMVYEGNESTMPYYGDPIVVAVSGRAKLAVGHPRKVTEGVAFPVRVHLYDAVGGAPIPNATVLLYSETLNMLLANATTDADGFVRFEVSLTGLGAHALNVTYPGDAMYGMACYRFEVEVVTYNVTYIESLPFNITEPGYYEVVDNLTANGPGIAIMSCNVTLDGGNYWVSAPGAYVLRLGSVVNVTVEELGIRGVILIEDSANVTLSGLRAQGAPLGIDRCSGVVLANSSLEWGEGEEGYVYVRGSVNVTFVSVNMTWSTDRGLDAHGLLLEECARCTLRDVRLRGRSLELRGTKLSHFASHVVERCEVNDKWLVLLANVSGVALDGKDVGELILANCSDIKVGSLTIGNVSLGVLVAFSRNVSIADSSIEAGLAGVHLLCSERCSLENITFRGTGILIEGSDEADYASHRIEGCSADGRPILYASSAEDLMVEGDYAQVFLMCCRNVTVGLLRLSGARPVLIEAAYSDYVVIQYVTAIGDANQAYTSYATILLVGCSRTLVAACQLCGASGRLLIIGGNETWLGGNDIEELHVEGCAQLRVTRCTVRRAFVAEGCNGAVYLNTFLGEVRCADCAGLSFSSPIELRYIYNGTEWRGALGNHYAGFVGVDTDGDGVIDQPYEGEGFVDPRPLARPHSDYRAEEELFMIVRHPEATAYPVGGYAMSFRIEVRILHVSNGSGVAGAEVRLYDEGANSLLASGYTDEKGAVVFELTPSTEGLLRLNATCPASGWRLPCYRRFEVQVAIPSQAVFLRIVDYDVVGGVLKIKVMVWVEAPSLSIASVGAAVDELHAVVAVGEPVSGTYGDKNVTVVISVDAHGIELGEHKIYVRAIARSGLTSYITWKEMRILVRKLCPRYNLIALTAPPPRPLNASDICRAIGEDVVSAIWRWIPEEQRFASYLPGVSGPEEDFPIEPGYGYFIYLKRSAILVEVLEVEWS